MTLPRVGPVTPEEQLKVNLAKLPGGSMMGRVRASRLVRGGGADARATPAANNVITGAQGDDTGTSITSTVAGPGTSSALAFDAVAIGDGALVAAPADNGVAVGRGAEVDQAYGVAVGMDALVQDLYGVAVGARARAVAQNGTAVGNNANATGLGAAAFGCDSSGTGATAIGTNDFILGTLQHKVNVPGHFSVGTATPVATQATPATLADVIAILQAFGLCT